MYNSDTELLFPTRVIASLAGQRSEPWQNLVERISGPEGTRLEQMAVVLMMVRLGGCVGCNADSFRAMKGCTQCARQNIRRFRGSDPELVELFQQTRKEVDLYLEKKNQAS